MLSLDRDLVRPWLGVEVVVASFIEIKTGYRGFETKRNPLCHMLVMCIENIIRGRT